MPRPRGRSIMPMPSAQSRTFSQVPSVHVPRSVLDRTHTHKTTFDAGRLVPIYLDEILPGDTSSLRMSAFARLNTPLFPIMDNLHLETFFFFVPNRLVWENWEKFCGAQDSPGDSIDFIIPQIGGAALPVPFEQSLYDYFGIPTGLDTNGSHTINALPFRAYNLIYNEWFRDENLQVPWPVPTDDGPDLPINYTVRIRGKRHDYFTACLPWPQKGDSVSVPIGSMAPVIGIGMQDQVFPQNPGPTFSPGGRDTNYTVATLVNPAVASGQMYVEEDPNNIGYPNIYADLAAATPATINDLRMAFQVQKFLERDARGGTRYIESIRSHFGVISPDQRLQRPEYLGGGHTPINITPIAQTAEGTGTFVGDLAAMGTASATNHGFSKSFVEHGWVIGLACVRADLTYQQGLPRQFSRRTREDYYWPSYAHLGEQAVLQKEIFTDNTATDEDVFGYQERHAEYRYAPNRITGLFRSDATGTLDAWHLAQDFAAHPLLTGGFLLEDPPIDRIVAVPSEPDFLFDSYFRHRQARPMPVYGVPGFVDHF